MVLEMKYSEYLRLEEILKKINSTLSPKLLVIDENLKTLRLVEDSPCKVELEFNEVEFEKILDKALKAEVEFAKGTLKDVSFYKDLEWLANWLMYIEKK